MHRKDTQGMLSCFIQYTESLDRGIEGGSHALMISVCRTLKKLLTYEEYLPQVLSVFKGASVTKS